MNKFHLKHGLCLVLLAGTSPGESLPLTDSAFVRSGTYADTGMVIEEEKLIAEKLTCIPH